MRIEQTISGGGSALVSPLAGVHLRILLGATAYSSITIEPPTGATQRMVVTVKQDGAGGRSIVSTWTNVRFPGGTYTASSGANAIDKVTLDWNNADAKWDASVAFNLS